MQNTVCRCSYKISRRKNITRRKGKATILVTELFNNIIDSRAVYDGNWMLSEHPVTKNAVALITFFLHLFLLCVYCIGNYFIIFFSIYLLINQGILNLAEEYAFASRPSRIHLEYEKHICCETEIYTIVHCSKITIQY